MELSEVFSSATLKAADLKGREATVVIESVEAKQFKDGNKLVIRFRGKEKALVCNKTNANRIAYAHGTNTNGWIGQQIVLYPDMVDFQGELVEAIRVKPPVRPSVAGNITTAPQRMAEDHSDDRVPQPPMRRADGPNDDIPF